MKKIILLCIFLVSISTLQAADHITKTRNSTIIEKRSASNDLVKRASPLINNSKNIQLINRYLSVGAIVDVNFASFTQSIDNNNNNLIYNKWDKLNGTNAAFGLNFRLRIPAEHSIFDYLWLNVGVMKGNSSYESEQANNAFFKLNDKQAIIDHTLKYEYDYMQYMFGLVGVFELSPAFSINGKFNIMLKNPSIMTITQTDILESQGQLFSNGQTTQTSETKEHTLRNILEFQIGPELEYRFWNDNWSMLLGLNANFSPDELVDRTRIDDRTGIITNKVSIEDRGLSSVYFSVSFGIQYNF